MIQKRIILSSIALLSAGVLLGATTGIRSNSLDATEPSYSLTLDCDGFSSGMRRANTPNGAAVTFYALDMMGTTYYYNSTPFQKLSSVSVTTDGNPSLVIGWSQASVEPEVTDEFHDVFSFPAGSDARYFTIQCGAFAPGGILNLTVTYCCA